MNTRNAQITLTKNNIQFFVDEKDENIIYIYTRDNLTLKLVFVESYEQSNTAFISKDLIRFNFFNFDIILNIDDYLYILFDGHIRVKL